eukprot:4865399-Alexandrium_andersonii.AAC.1
MVESGTRPEQSWNAPKVPPLVGHAPTLHAQQATRGGHRHQLNPEAQWRGGWSLFRVTRAKEMMHIAPSNPAG